MQMHIPPELKALPYWVCWRLTTCEGEEKARKVPHYAASGRMRKGHGTADDRAQLVTFDIAKSKPGYSGVGFAVLQDAGFVFLDFDHCVSNGVVDPRVLELVQGTYAELSPSGTGVRAVFRGALPSKKDNGSNEFDVEFFGTSGFVTVTGNVLPEHEMFGWTEIIPLTPEVMALYTARFGAPVVALADDFSMVGLGPKPELTLEQARELVFRLNPNCGYDDWWPVGAALHHQFDGDEAAFKVFVDWSLTGENPATLRVMEQKWDSFGRYNGAPRTMAWVMKMAKPDEASALHDLLADIESSSASAVIQRLAAASLSATGEEEVLKRLKATTKTSMGALRADLASEKRAAKNRSPGTHHGLALQLLDELQQRAHGEPLVGVEGALYEFNGSIYVPRSSLITEVARRFDGLERCERRNDYKGISDHAYDLASAGNEDFFVNAPIGLACTDGFHRVTPDGHVRIEPLAANHRQRYMLNVKPEARPMPQMGRYLEETFAAEDPSETVEQIALVQELMGAIALGVMARHEKAALFYGPGRAGKGTMLKIIEALVPREAQASVSPMRWHEEYYLAGLAAKRLNVVGELPDDIPIPAADFKTVTGRDSLTGRHPMERPFAFRNEAAHVFNSNHFVTTRDHTEAFFSRWIIVGFLNSRLDKDPAAIDVDLAARIVSEELPAILAWAVDGARRLVARGHFQTTRVQDRLMAQWRRRTDSVMEFLQDEDECELGQGLWAKRTDLYEVYSVWCRKTNRKAIGKQKFHDAIEAPAVAQMGIEVARHATLSWLARGVRLRHLCIDLFAA